MDTNTREGWLVHEQKAGVAEELNGKYMTSEESSCNEEQQGKTTLYRLKRFPWELDKLKKARKALDDAYKQGLTKWAKDRIPPRKDANELSTRSAPTLC